MIEQKAVEVVDNEGIESSSLHRDVSQPSAHLSSLWSFTADVSLRLLLNESDFVWILEQFPFRNFLSYLFGQVCGPVGSRGVVAHAFGIAKTVLSLLSNGINKVRFAVALVPLFTVWSQRASVVLLAQLVEYKQFGKLCARTLTWISWIVVEAYSNAQVALSRCCLCYQLAPSDVTNGDRMAALASQKNFACISSESWTGSSCDQWPFSTMRLKK